MTDVIDKIDLKTFIGDLEKEEKPKTLEECLKEAGGFPFAAKAVVCCLSKDPRYGARAVPVGDVRQFIGVGSAKDFPAEHPFYVASGVETVTDARVPRWQLLGHKT